MKDWGGRCPQVYGLAAPRNSGARFSFSSSSGMYMPGSTVTVWFVSFRFTMRFIMFRQVKGDTATYAFRGSHDSASAAPPGVNCYLVLIAVSHYFGNVLSVFGINHNVGEVLDDPFSQAYVVIDHLAV